jgi:hypothetical protein
MIQKIERFSTKKIKNKNLNLDKCGHEMIKRSLKKKDVILAKGKF